MLRAQCSASSLMATKDTAESMRPATSSSTAATKIASLLAKYGYEAVVDSPASRQTSTPTSPGNPPRAKRTTAALSNAWRVRSPLVAPSFVANLLGIRRHRHRTFGRVVRRRGHVAAAPVDATGALRAPGDTAAHERAGVEQRAEERPQGPVAQGRTTGRSIDRLPGLPRRQADRCVRRPGARWCRTSRWRCASPDSAPGSVRSDRPPPIVRGRASERRPDGEPPLGGGTSSRLDHRIGFLVLAGQLLHQVGHLFSAEDEEAEEGRHRGQDRQHHLLGEP